MTARGEKPPTIPAELCREVAADQCSVVTIVVGLLRPSDPGGRPVVTLIRRVPDERAMEARAPIVVFEHVPAPHDPRHNVERRCGMYRRQDACMSERRPVDVFVGA